MFPGSDEKGAFCLPSMHRSLKQPVSDWLAKSCQYWPDGLATYASQVLAAYYCEDYPGRHWELDADGQNSQTGYLLARPAREPITVVPEVIIRPRVRLAAQGEGLTKSSFSTCIDQSGVDPSVKFGVPVSKPKGAHVAVIHWNGIKPCKGLSVRIAGRFGPEDPCDTMCANVPAAPLRVRVFAEHKGI